MENAVLGFRVHLDVDINVGDNWYESKWWRNELWKKYRNKR
jgi:hypothetical protein